MSDLNFPNNFKTYITRVFNDHFDFGMIYCMSTFHTFTGEIISPGAQFEGNKFK